MFTKKKIEKLNKKYFPDFSRILSINNSKVKINVNKFFLEKLFTILQEFVDIEIDRVDILLDKELFTSTDLSKIFSRISSMRYHYQGKIIFSLQNIPYCIIKQAEGLVYFSGNRNDFIRKDFCEKCKYNSRCLGIEEGYNSEELLDMLELVKDKPREIMIEIEEKCNLDCEFCFNKNSFAKNGRNIKNNLSVDYIKRIIDSIAKNKISVLRFTGGEPLLREDIWKLAEYAKIKKLELRLNTNGLLIKDKGIAKKIAKYFDNILLPIQYSDVNVNNKEGVAKIKAINLLKKAGLKIIRIGTVATKEVIYNLDKVNEFIEKLKINKWELYRPISTPDNKNSFSKADVKKLVDGLIEIKKRTGKTHYIINAIPFCSYDPKKIQSIAIGADAVDGHERFAVDPRGFAKPSYYIEKNIGDPTDIEKCWNHSFMKKMRNLENVPRECKKCIFLDKCKGGCRFSAFVADGKYDSKDPLMNKKNVIKI